MPAPMITDRDANAPSATPRVAYVLVWFPKPSETFVFREVRALREHGLAVEVFTMYGPLRRDLSPAMRDYDGPVTRIGLRNVPRVLGDLCWWLRRSPRRTLEVLALLPRRWRSWETAGEALLAVGCAFRLARLFLARGITHIHADWANGPATAAWAASRLTGLRFTFTGRAGDIFPPDGALRLKGRDCHAIRTDVGRNVPYLVAQADVPPHKVRLIYAALALDVQEPAAPRFCPPFRLVAVGRFVPKKGFAVLLQAVQVLRQQGLDLRLCLAGSGPLERALKQQCRDLGLDSVVEFPGFVPHDRVPEFLRGADVFVMSSVVVGEGGDRDGIPNVILEAMAHGLPVVGTDVSGIGEVVRDGETGVLVPPEDPVALAEGIARLCAEPATALALARAGQALVLERFAPERTAAALAALYTEA